MKFIQISDLHIPLNYNIELLKNKVAQRLCIEQRFIEKISVARELLVTADKQDIYFNITALVSLSGDIEKILLSRRDKTVTRQIAQVYTVPWKILKKRPVVVGCGPAGMFAALILAQAGARPVLLERGLDVDSRKKKVVKFWKSGILDTCTNMQFGEGGAGAFSDGKLKTGKIDARKMMVLKALVEAGAPPEIIYLAKPHIGTDRLRETVKGMRNKIISLGGEVHFGTTVRDILRKGEQVSGVGFLEKGDYNTFSTDNVVLAIGHSARDTFENLFNGGIHLEQRPIAIGVRVEHPQELIDRIQYGNFAGHPALGAADYRMVVHLQNGRGVYTFCMCPGGTVVAATSEENCLVTNGMSEFKRDGRNANSALLVTIGKKDYGSDHPLAGVDFQRRIENAAFASGGGNYKAPVARIEDFLNKRTTRAFGDVLPTYLPGTGFADLDSCLPDYVTESLRQAIREMGEWMPGFLFPDALLTGAETRSSSPVKITRGETLEAIGINGLYPCGEGAGYAGGIISAAVDGVLCAERILGNINKELP